MKTSETADPSRVATVVSPRRGTLRPVPISDVRITGGYWADRQRANAEATLKHCVGWMERLGWIGNFDRISSRATGAPAGREFADSEVYKLLEALVWESARSGNEWAEATYRSLSARVVAAQQPDGYLNTRFGAAGLEPRYSDLEWGHELYCAGHLIQAAVARARTAGRDDFVDAAVRLADHVCHTFGPDGLKKVGGHPEIEVALAELSRVTGDARYLDQARLFVERRGGETLNDPDVPSSYFLDDVRVRDADVLRGHAVRALYLAAGAVDVAVDTEDEELLTALREQWRNTVARRTYLTGGMGSRHEGESFGEDFELPSDRAYSETCAGVASVMFSWRMLLADGDAKYADLIERTLYNVVAASPDEAGTSFFYVNPLQRNRPGDEPERDRPSARAASSQRAPWFAVSCCPTNVARTMASLSGYVATVNDDGLQLHQYMPSSIRTVLGDGRTIALRVETTYPAEGTVAVMIEDDSDQPWTLTMRVPSWATGAATLTDAAATTTVEGSTVSVTRAFRGGDRIVLELPIAPRLTVADERVDAVRGCVAVEAGPLVLCAESTDQPGMELAEFRVDPRAVPHTLPATADGPVAVLDATVLDKSRADRAWPYGAAKGQTKADVAELKLIPYNRWAERGPSQMRVWLPLATAAPTFPSTLSNPN